MTSKALVRKTKTASDPEASLKTTTGVYIADFSRITVQTVTALRTCLRKKGIRMKVAKNTLIKRALGTAGIKGLDAHLKGPTAVILADDQDPMAPAKALVEFHKANEGLLAGQERLHRRSRLSGQPARRGEDAGQTRAAGFGGLPGARTRPKIMGILKGPGATLAGQIKVKIEKFEKGGAA